MKLSNEQIKKMKKNATTRDWTARLELLGEKYNKKGNKILDIGIAGDIHPGGDAYIFQEATYETLDIDKQFNPTYTADVRAMPFADASYDVVICTCVLEHVLEKRHLAYKDIYRILKPGGLAIVAGPLEITRSETEEASPMSMDEIVQAIPGVSAKATYYKGAYGEELIFAEIKK